MSTLPCGTLRQWTRLRNYGRPPAWPCKLARQSANPVKPDPHRSRPDSFVIDKTSQVNKCLLIRSSSTSLLDFSSLMHIMQRLYFSEYVITASQATWLQSFQKNMLWFFSLVRSNACHSMGRTGHADRGQNASCIRNQKRADAADDLTS